MVLFISLHCFSVIILKVPSSCLCLLTHTLTDLILLDHVLERPTTKQQEQPSGAGA